MANTTNFNWETPDDTDLVKDGAAAIRTLGSAIDTSLVDLKGGTTGQILSKATNTDMDFTWITNDVGDITEVVASAPLTGGGASGSVTVGIQDGTTAQKGAVQLENSTSSTSTTTAAVPASVKSAYDLANAAIPKSLVDAAGDLIYATANDTPARLALGTAGQVLKVNSGATAPEWGAATSTPTFVGCSVYASAEQSLNNNTNTILTFDSEDFDTDAFHSTSSNTGRITIPSGKGGKYQIQAFGNWANNSTGRRYMYLYKNGTAFALTETIVPSVTSSLSWYLNIVVSAVATDYFELRATQTSGGALACRVNGDGSVDSISGRFQATFIGA